MLLKLTDVHKTYRSKSRAVPALSGVSLELQAGQFVAIRGPSGCGKSTLLLTAGTLLAPERGEVLVAGENPYRMAPDLRATYRARNIGFVFQQFHLVPYLSVLENVLAATLALVQTQQAVTPAKSRERALALLEQFGLTDRLQHTPGQLSSGERQRCALARALLNEPRLLLADEPTGNLDPENADLVLAALREFAQGGGAVLLVTHDERASSVADEILWMSQGTFKQPTPAGAM